VTTISICIVSARPDDLRCCLASVTPQLRPGDEVLVYANGAGIADVAPPPVTVVEGPRCSLGAARNRLIEAAGGELVVFLDDDTICPAGLLDAFTSCSEAHPEVGVFGGPNLTPPDAPAFQIAQGLVLASLIGGGPARRRYRLGPPTSGGDRNLTLCNMAVRRDLAPAFREDLTGGEETDLLARLHRDGVTMRSDPRLMVWHQRRRTLGAFARQMHKYGDGRGETTPRPALTWAAAILPIAVAVLAATGAITDAAALTAGTYTTTVAAYACAAGLRTRSPVVALAFAVQAPTLHSSYLLGLARGATRPRRPTTLEARSADHVPPAR
jgi:hypothetical protein